MPIGGGAWPMMRACAMCCATRKAVFSNSPAWMCLPRPVRCRSSTAASTPSAAKVPPIRSLTDDPARIGLPGRPVM